MGKVMTEMLNLVVEQRRNGLSDVLANDLGISPEQAQDLIRADGRLDEDLRPIRLSAVRRVAGSLLIGAGRLVGGSSLSERAGSAA